MIKKYLPSLLLLLGTVFASPLYASIGDIEWAQSQLAKYPELKWLADDKVRGTQHGTSGDQAPKLSYALFGKTYDELDRTLHTLKCLALFLKGDEDSYKELIKAQPVNEQLTFESFKVAGAAARALIQENTELEEAMKMALIFGDMGKTDTAWQLAKQHGITEADHDHFLHQVLEKCPEIFPSYEKLSPTIQQWLKKELPVHLGHLTHLEGGPEILTPLKRSQIAHDDPKAIDFFLFVHVCDVAGALAHVNNQGSLTYTENIHQTMELIRETLKVLATKDELTALRYYIKKRAEWLGLNTELKQDRILTRLGTMVRFYTPQEGQVLKSTLAKIDNKDTLTLLNRFDPLKSHLGRTPTYVPAVLLNLKDNVKCGKSLQERLFFAINEGLRFILSVMEDYELSIQTIEKVLAKHPAHCEVLALSYLKNLTLCFNQLAKQAKENPTLLQSTHFKINQDGDVTAKE